MTRLRRPLLQVATGLAAVVGLTAVRSVLSWRRQRQGRPVRRSRGARKRARARARAADRWALQNVDTLRRFLDTSESASAHLSASDNARRTADSFLSAAGLVRERLTADRSSSASTKTALQTKLDDLRSDAAPHQQAATTATAEVARLQASLQEQVKALRGPAPTDITAAASALVAAHEQARRSMSGAVDEVAARRRLDELSALREAVEAMLADLTRAGR